MADERPFNEYFANRTVLPGDVLIANDELLVLRGSTVYRHPGSLLFAYGSMDSNIDVTTINVQGVFEPMAGTLIDSPSTTTEFTFLANQYTYVGPNQAGSQILSAKMSVLKVGGGEDSFEVGVFVNNLQVGTGMISTASSSLVGFMQTSSPHSLQTNDVIDMRIANVSSASNVTVVNAQLIIG
jgi:hypothetical protein